MKAAAFFVFVSVLGNAAAFWRMECRGRAGIGRIDPLISPGEVSQHAHVIHGSSGFSETSEYGDLLSANCTSCAVTQDKSAYWTPAMYFHHVNGSYELVPQVGGMLSYYFLNPDAGQIGNITAFPEGFHMIAGDSLRRNYSVAGMDYTQPDPPQSLWAELNQTTQGDLAQRAIGFNCLNYGKRPPEGTLIRHYLPTKDYLDANCLDGIRLELMFPSCWNGHDLDSPNHKDHVAYPDLVMDGTCPEGFKTKLPGLFYETIWGTDSFTGFDGEFVLANGDVQGFGYHGDFIMGWDEIFLQEAVNTCLNLSGRIEDCPLFNLQDDYTQNQCSIDLPSQLATESVTGVIGTTLPGNVAIQYGPQPATAANPGPRTTTVPVPTQSYVPGTTVSGSTLGVGGILNPSSSSTTVSKTPNIAQIVPTPTPAMPTPADDPNAFSTQYITNGLLVTEVIWEKEIVYVTEEQVETQTVTVGGAAKARRMAHMHGHQGRHGGRART